MTWDSSPLTAWGKGAPELWDLYMAYDGRVFAEGALTAREKALIALAVAAAGAVPVLHRRVHELVHGERRLTEEQMTEAFHVANAIRGGAALVHGVQMKNIVKNLEM